MMKDCPACGYENDDALGVFSLSGEDAGEFTTDRVKCGNCGYTYQQ